MTNNIETLKEIWLEVLLKIKGQITKIEFASWFKDSALLSIEGQTVVIGSGSKTGLQKLETSFRDIVSKSLSEVLGFPVELKLTVDTTLRVRDKRTVPVSKVIRIENRFKKEQQIDGITLTQGLKTRNLNPIYTIDKFIVGDSNRLAHACSLSVLAKPGKVYNPLFIYGGVGLGKTHLLQAIGNELQKKNSSYKILYNNSEKLTSDIVNSMQKGSKAVERLRRNYRGVDVLIIDDIQFIAGKDKTQEEFFHLFNVLREADRQIILSSDRPPIEINNLEGRLRSRFESGMIVDVQMPDFETRVAILQSKCQERRKIVALDILEFLAYNITSSIRALEGALTQVLAREEHNEWELTVDSIKDIINIYTGRREVTTVGGNTSFIKRSLTSDELLQEVSTYFGVHLEEIIGKSRKKEFVVPRQVCMFIMRKKMNMSLERIGSKFGGKDHTTVLYAVKKVEDDLEYQRNDFIKTTVYNLEKKLELI